MLVVRFKFYYEARKHNFCFISNGFSFLNGSNIVHFIGLQLQFHKRRRGELIISLKCSIFRMFFAFLSRNDLRTHSWSCEGKKNKNNDPLQCHPFLGAVGIAFSQISRCCCWIRGNVYSSMM